MVGRVAREESGVSVKGIKCRVNPENLLQFANGVPFQWIVWNDFQRYKRKTDAWEMPATSFGANAQLKQKRPILSKDCRFSGGRQQRHLEQM